MGGSSIAVHGFEFSCQNEIPPKGFKFCVYILPRNVAIVKPIRDKKVKFYETYILDWEFLIYMFINRGIEIWNRYCVLNKNTI